MRLGAPEAAADGLLALLEALAAEPDPPTTVTEASEALELHVADSLTGLSIGALREATAIADIGSGAGFPGLPLAVARPNARVDLIESVARKCATIERLANAADAANARAVAARTEHWARGEGHEAYAGVTARAVAPLAVLCEYAAPLLALGGTLVCWKGARRAGEERAGERAAALLGLRALAPVRVEPFPGAHSRHLHAFEKVEPTPPRFPRRPGMASKRPLTS
jgi:16S rRNA (guanine527-N7)-methyltransferase